MAGPFIGTFLGTIPLGDTAVQPLPLKASSLKRATDFRTFFFDFATARRIAKSQGKQLGGE
jgi:hypothetical protein